MKLKKLAFEATQEKGIVTKCIQEKEMASLRCHAIFLSERIFPYGHSMESAGPGLLVSMKLRSKNFVFIRE